MLAHTQSTKNGVITALLSSILLLSGCQATKNVVNKFDNGSLNYQKAKQLDPIILPVEQATSPFTPLYPIPYIRENTVVLTNESGTRYELPPPFRSSTVSSKESN